MKVQPKHAAVACLTAALLAAGAATTQAQTASKLTVWLVGDDSGPKILQPAVNAYRAKNPNVTFEVRAVPWGDAYTKYLAAVASKTGPDIITGGLSFGISLGKQGGMVNIKEKYPAFAAEVAKVANPGVMRSATSTDGALYAVPYDLTTQMMYYRTDQVKAAPKTWAQLSSSIEALRTSGKKGFVMSWGNVSWLGYFPFLYQAGGRLYDAACAKATVNSAQGVAALRYFADFYTKYKAPTDASPDLEGGLESGDYGVGMSGQWSLVGIAASRPKLEGKWAAAKLPAGSSGKSTAFIGGTVMGITSYSKNADRALDFIKTVYSTGAATGMIDAANKLGTLWVPARTDLATLVKLPADRRAALVAQLRDAEGPPNCAGWEETSPALDKAIQSVIFSGADPKAALDTAAAEMDKGLKR